MTVFTKPGSSKTVTATNKATVKVLKDAGWEQEKSTTKRTSAKSEPAED